jgi:hypothetical protein
LDALDVKPLSISGPVKKVLQVSLEMLVFVSQSNVVTNQKTVIYCTLRERLLVLEVILKSKEIFELGVHLEKFRNMWIIAISWEKCT